VYGGCRWWGKCAELIDAMENNNSNEEGSNSKSIAEISVPIVLYFAAILLSIYSTASIPYSLNLSSSSVVV
jgi:hypothetical protein